MKLSSSFVMNVHSWNKDNKFEMQVNIDGRSNVNGNPSLTSEPGQDMCMSNGRRRCGDGSCATRTDMCPEEQMVNQTTVFILITVGMAVIVVLVILYCFQKRSQRIVQGRNTDQVTFVPVISDGDNSSLNMPPPAYDEVVNSSLNPVPSALQRNIRIPSTEEPRTPPPNYDAALYILAHSHDSVCPMKEEPKSPVVRRSISTELGSSGSGTRIARSSDSDFRRLYSNPEPR